MNKLLAIEWLKIKRYRTFWVLAGLFVVLMPLFNYQISSGSFKIGGDGKNGINLLSTAYSFPQVWANLGFWSGLFINFLSILIIILTTNEYAYRTNRQNVIDGWSKMQFYHAKVWLVVALSVCTTIFFFITGLVFGWGTSGSLGGLFTDIEQVAYFFITSLDYLGLGLLIALWIKRSGLAIGLFLLYSMIGENVVRWMINSYIDVPYANLLPLQASDELLPFQLMEMMKKMVSAAPSISLTIYALVATGWCIIYYFAGRLILQRRDW
jgi:ABC-2 type transport system permease protein